MRPTPRPLVGAAVSILLCQAGPASARVFTSCTGGDESVTRIRIDEDARTARGPFYNVPTGRTLSYKIKRETTGHLSWGDKLSGCDFDPIKKAGSCGGMMEGSYSFKCRTVE